MEEGGGDEDMSGMARIVIRMNIRKQRYKPTRSGTSHEWRQFVFVFNQRFYLFLTIFSSYAIHLSSLFIPTVISFHRHK